MAHSINYTLTRTSNFMSDYAIYIRKMYGEEVWDRICDTRLFGRIMFDLILEYGKAAFQDVVKTTSKTIGIPVRDILVGFVNYLKEF